MKRVGAFLLLVGGAGLAYWVKKRQFERTNGANRQPFKSYSNMVVVTTLEKVVWTVALTCIVVGGLFAM